MGVNIEPPRPLDEMPAEALAALQGVLTDIDDTLTRDGAIEPAARAALQALANAGLPAIAITGRPAGWSETLAHGWPLAAIVAENGGVLLQRDAHGALRRHFTVDDATRAERFERLQACANDIMAAVPGATLARDSDGRLTDIAIDHSEFTQFDAAQIEAVLAVMQRHGLNATVSSIHVNGWIGAHDKWSGARWAVEACLARPLVAQDWLYVGDSANDQVVFAQLPLSVGVANIARCLPQLRTPPAYLTRGERGVGFAEVVARLLDARTGRTS